MSADSSVVSLAREGAVAVITVDHPPVNALSSAVRAGLVDALDAALADDAVRAIVVACAGDTFCAGADIREFDLPPQPPHLTDVIQRFADAGKPVIAALHGNALGGGCELAAGCHYRIAAAGTRIGLPEVNLGLLPGAGGTQRLPRLIGFDAALSMMLDGRPRPVESAELTGFTDEIVEGDVARRSAFCAADRERGIRSPAHRQPAAARRGARSLRAARRSRAAAPRRACAGEDRRRGPPRDRHALCRGGCARPRRFPRFARHAGVEGAAARLLRRTRSRQAARRPEVGTPSALSTVAVIGAGTMGQGIAIALLEAGLEVTLVEAAEPALARAKGVSPRISRRPPRRAGSPPPPFLSPRPPQRRDRHRGDRRSRLVIEAVFEDLGVKRELFAHIDAIAKPGALLATNTSYLDVAEIAGFTRRPQEVIGLHFFSPANVMRLVEIVRTDVTSASALATGVALVRRLKKVGVVCKGKDGFVGNRMLVPRTRECLFMLEEGALPQQIDAALFDFGFAMGPLAVADLAGVDIGWRNANLRRQLRELGRDCDLLDQLVAASRLGQKTGAGWYRYDKGSRRPLPDPAVEAMLFAHSRARGIARRAIPPAEIVERCLLGMINEAARILDEGVVARASDIDVVWLTGYGFPRFRGGPLYYADRMGLAIVLQRIEALRDRLGAAYWTPAPALARLAAAGQGSTTRERGRDPSLAELQWERMSTWGF